MTAPLVTITNHTPGHTITLDDLEPYMLDAPRLDPPARPPARGTPLETPTTGQRPGDLFNAANTPEDVLLDAGWTLHHTDPNGEKHYTRPGKNTRDGSSATVYPDGHACIWTDATELEPRRWYDAFGLLAAIRHGGSHIEATAHVRSLGYGTPVSTPSTSTAPTTGALEHTDGDTTVGIAAWFVNWDELWGREAIAEDWLVPPVIARGRGHAVFAKAGAGKSWITLEIAAALATGRPIFQRPASDPVDVLYVDYEMTADDLRDRLETFGYDADSDLTRLHYALTPGIPPLDTIDGGHMLVEGAKACGAELVVIDTTARAVAGEENDANVYRAFYRHTGMALKQAGIAWIRLDHAGKELEKGQRGSSAKNDDVDIVWRLEQRQGHDLRLVATKRRMPWVQETVDLSSKETELGMLHFTAEATYPDRTMHVVKFLDDHQVPLNLGRTKVRALLREHGENASNEAVSAALKYRRSRPEKLSAEAPDRSSRTDPPGQVQTPLSHKARTAPDRGSDVGEPGGLSHVVDSPGSHVPTDPEPTPIEDDEEDPFA